MIRRRLIVLLAAAVAVCFLPLRIAAAADAATLAAALESIRADDLRKHATVLASDTFEGREAGTAGGKAAGVYLVERLQKLGMQGAGVDAGYYQAFGHSVGADYRNILALMPGSDPKLKDEYIIVGAHYDHVGYGNSNNSMGPIGYIHNGADDNASGTAGLLELAEAFLLLEPRPKRSILFALWDAEEKGLLGSEHWLAEPTVKLAQVRLLLNLDMIGRLRENTLTVYGSRTAAGLRRLVSEQNQEQDLRLNFDWDILRDSDHHPFFQQRIPFLMLYTEKHEDYHRPSDDVHKLNVAGMQQATRLMFRIALEAADRGELPAFRPVSANENQSTRLHLSTPLPALPARFGVSWDKDLAARGTVKLTFVSPGSAAARAGLKAGDRIVEFGGERPDSVEDFRLLVHRSRSPAVVVVERAEGAPPLKLTVHLDGEPLSLGIGWRVDEAEPGCIIVARVTPGTPADLAGLQVGDRIYSVAGQSFDSSEEFRRLIHTGDEALELVAERAGRVSRLQAPINARRRTK